MNVLLIRNNLLSETQTNYLEKKDIAFKTIHQEDFNNFQKSVESISINVIVGATELREIDFSRFPNLLFIQTISAGYDYLQTEEVFDRSIYLSNASGIYSIPIAEWVIGLILTDFKHFAHFYTMFKKKIWHPIYSLKELTDKKILIFGTGSIGKEISKRLTNFNCIIDGVNSNGREVVGFRNSFTLENAKHVVDQYDVLIFALPSNSHTRKYVNEDLLNRLKNDTILMNVGRGDLIDDENLINYVNNTNIEVRFYLDVSSIEPLEENSMLWQSPNIFITPHNSFSSDKHLERLQKLIFTNINALIDNSRIINKIEGEQNETTS